MQINLFLWTWYSAELVLAAFNWTKFYLKGQIKFRVDLKAFWTLIRIKFLTLTDQLLFLEIILNIFDKVVEHIMYTNSTLTSVGLTDKLLAIKIEWTKKNNAMFWKYDSAYHSVVGGILGLNHMNNLWWVVHKRHSVNGGGRLYPQKTT